MFALKFSFSLKKKILKNWLRHFGGICIKQSQFLTSWGQDSNNISTNHATLVSADQNWNWDLNCYYHHHLNCYYFSLDIDAANRGLVVVTHTHTAGGSSCRCCNSWSFPFNALCPYQSYPVSKLQHRALAPGMGEAYISHASEPALALLCVLSRYYTKRQREPETWVFWRPAEWLVGYVLPYSERLHSVKVLDGNRWVNPAPVEAVLTLWRHGVKYVYVYTGNISEQCIHTHTHTHLHTHINIWWTYWLSSDWKT